MKKIILLAFTAIIVSNCSKKPFPVDPPITSSGGAREKFKDTLVLYASPNYNNIFVTYCPSNNSFFAVQKISTSQYNLHKSDLEINLIYTKTIDLGPNELIGIKGAQNECSFYTLNSTNNFIPGNQPLINAYARSNYIMDSASHCMINKIYDYQYDDSFQSGADIKGVNYSTLNKFDANGNLVWSNQLTGNYFDGNSLETDPSGNIYVLTANKLPRTPKLNVAFSSTLIPYYDLVVDSNSFSIYKFNSSGNQIFKKTITQVKDINYWTFNPSLNVSKTNITISNINNLYTFDLDGNLLSQNKPVSNACYNYISSVISNPEINNTFVCGTLNYQQGNPAASLRYIASYNGTSPTVLSQTANYSQLTLIDNLENIYLASSSYLAKINNNGGFTYGFLPLYDPPYNFILDKKSGVIDKYNSLYCFSNRLDHIAVYKFDNDGKYK